METYFDDDVQETLPTDRTLRYERLKAMWDARMGMKELRDLRQLYGDYEWGIEKARIDAIRHAIREMEADDRQAWQRWCWLVGGARNADLAAVS